MERGHPMFHFFLAHIFDVPAQTPGVTERTAHSRWAGAVDAVKDVPLEYESKVPRVKVSNRPPTPPFRDTVGGAVERHRSRERASENLAV